MYNGRPQLLVLANVFQALRIDCRVNWGIQNGDVTALQQFSGSLHQLAPVNMQQMPGVSMDVLRACHMAGKPSAGSLTQSRCVV